MNLNSCPDKDKGHSLHTVKVSVFTLVMYMTSEIRTGKVLMSLLYVPAQKDSSQGLVLDMCETSVVSLTKSI